MDSRRVVILSSHSLFADGTASSLRKLEANLEVSLLDPQQPDLHAELRSLQPSVVIAEHSLLSSRETCPLAALVLQRQPVRLIWLLAETDQIQVIQAERRAAGSAAELLAAIRSLD